MGWLSRAVLLAAALLAAALVAFAAWVSSAEADQPAVQYELAGQILTRLREDGRLEFCFRPQGEAPVCPQLRIVNLERTPPGRWVASSEFSWSIPVNSDRIVYSGSARQVESGGGRCDPDFGRMFAATWKVETTRSFGSAFHIGGGRFVTAHHVVERRPPFVSLIHGQRTVAAAVIGADREFDLALLEVERPELIADVPVLNLRSPTRDDIGDPVHLIGYPGGEALTLHGGGVVTQVWDHSIQTNSTLRGGTSGGPLFDQCGDVIGVVWAGSGARAYANSGSALRMSIGRIKAQWPVWPRVPNRLPSSLDAAGRLVWHYGAEPPPQVDCAELDAEWWVGVAGVGDEIEVRADLAHSGWRQIGVCGADGPDDHDNGRTYVSALARVLGDTALTDADRCGLSAEDAEDTLLLQAHEPFGALRVYVRETTPDCDDQRAYALRLDLETPQVPGVDIRAALIGRDGRVAAGAWTGKSYQGATLSPDSPIVSFWQDWTAPADFEPIAIRVAIGPEAWTTPIDSPAPEDAQSIAESAVGRSIEQSARIWVRQEEGGAVIRVCIRPAAGNRICPDAYLPVLSGFVENRWHESPPLRWTADVSDEALPTLRHARPLSVSSCAYQDSAHFAGWQFTSLAGSGTAVYVGQRQFLVSRYRLPETAPWGVVARGGDALAVVGIAADPRNDLALVEVFDPEADIDLGPSAVFGSTGERLVGRDAHLLAYPTGSARRFTLAVLNVNELTERVIRVEPTGNGRHGGPLLDLCSGALLGLALGGDDLLRAETVQASLAEMRTRIERPEFSQDGPPAHGSAAAHSGPLYAGEMQPEFSGKICDIHPSERYDQLYAVYVSRIDAPNLWRVYERDGARPDTCDWGDKIFIVEYRADEAPEAICMEPYRPELPYSTVEWELEAPDGIELLQAVDFVRDDCPGLSRAEQLRWFSSHYFKLRNTSKIEFDDLSIRIVTDEGRRLAPRRDTYVFADDDVRGYRLRVTQGTPVRVVVTER